MGRFTLSRPKPGFESRWGRQQSGCFDALERNDAEQPADVQLSEESHDFRFWFGFEDDALRQHCPQNVTCHFRVMRKLVEKLHKPRSYLLADLRQVGWSGLRSDRQPVEFALKRLLLQLTLLQGRDYRLDSATLRDRVREVLDFHSQQV